MVELGFSVHKSMNIRDYATPYWQHLSLEHRETVDLVIFENSEVIYLQVIESPQRIKIAAAPGERLPAFCTATGKAFLAYLPDAKSAKYSSRVCASTPIVQTCHSASFANQSLRHVRDQGFAIAEEEYEGVNAVAAPILDHHRRPIAAIAVVGPAFRLPGEQMKRIGKSVKATAEQIAQEIAISH